MDSEAIQLLFKKIPVFSLYSLCFLYTIYPPHSGERNRWCAARQGFWLHKVHLTEWFPALLQLISSRVKLCWYKFLFSVVAWILFLFIWGIITSFSTVFPSSLFAGKEGRGGCGWSPLRQIHAAKQLNLAKSINPLNTAISLPCNR